MTVAHPPPPPVAVKPRNPPRRPGVSLAVWVAGVSLLALIPMLAFSALILYRDIAEQQRQGLEALGRRATTVAAALGHELDGVFTQLAALSLADGVRQGDLRATYDLSVRLVEADPRIASISLSAASGRQPFITSRPFGTALPDSRAGAKLRPLFEGSERVVSALVEGEVSQQRVVGLARPLAVGAAGVYAIRAVIRLDAIAARFNEQAWPAGWTAAVIDDNGIIIARSHDAERYVGQPATPGVLESARKTKGIFYASTKDGVATAACAAPVPGTGWHVVIGRPLAALQAQVRDSMASIFLAGALCALLGIGAAALVARSIALQLRQVVALHVGGRPTPWVSSRIKEVEEVAAALAAARAAASAAFAELSTAREDALAQLQERGEMLDVLAHEVRQPLHNASAALQEANTVIVGSVSPVVAAPLSRANSVLSEVLVSIDNTLAVAALLVGDNHIQRVDCDIDTVVGLAIADMAADQVARVRVERIAGTRTAAMEPNLMRLALRNLLSNALKFSPRDSPVTVRIADSDEPLAVIIDVIDSGGGIDGELLPRLFDRGGRKRQNLGGRRQGLGLYIVRRVMQLHGGTVTLERNGASGTMMRLMVVQSLDE